MSLTLRDLKRLDAESISRVPPRLLNELCRIDDGMPAPVVAPDEPAYEYRGKSIIEAMDDPELFGAHFVGDTWDTWRVFLAALFAIPLTSDQVPTFRRLTERSREPERVHREAALICGRRGGKSRVLALIAVYLACFVDHTPWLAVGEMATVAVISADRKQARTVMRYIMGLLEQTHVLAPQIKGATSESVTLEGRVIIEVHTASFRVSRGYTLVAVLADEIAFWPPEDSATPDVEIIRAVRPGMASIPHSMLLMASSPYAKRGVLWQTYKQHYGHADSRVLVWKASTEDMNPRIDPAFIAEEREKDPESASAEYDGNFRDDVAVFVSREIIDACVPSGLAEIEPEKFRTIYTAFCDPSGGSSDSMTLAIGHSDQGRPVLDLIREVRAPFSPEAVVAEFTNTLKTYKVTKVTGDRYAGEWPRERFAIWGVTYEISELSKSQIYQAFLPQLNSAKCQLLDNPRLIAQLASLERRTARGGRDSIDHPPGGHDDVANSVAGVLTLISGGPQPLVVSDAVLQMLGQR